MRLSIWHETTYRYDFAVNHTVKRLCLTPSQFDTQHVIMWSIEAPGIDNALVLKDAYGNTVHLTAASGGHSTVTVVAHGVVDCEDAVGVVRGIAPTMPDAVYLRQTPATRPTLAMMDWQDRKAKPTTGNTLQTLHDLMSAIHGKVDYEIGATDQSTTAAESFAAGRGVCQDHAHILVGLARHLGIPARYVTGYLVTGVGASSTASHAWAEALVPNLGWVGFDAANNTCPTEAYVRVACGLEAASVTPIRGSRRGGGPTEAMDVAVRVEIAQQ